MARNIVICCDGTANEFSRTNTNVVKLFSMLVHDPTAQATFYHPGLGTMEAPAALTPLARTITRVLGLAVGYGLSNDIRDAYVFLMRNYQPGDKVFLFGFSRGAYTVRAVASLLRGYGLIRAGNEPLVPYAIRMMMASRQALDKKDPAAAKAYFDLASEFKRTMSLECKPHFVGVWDTVASVGWIENPLALPYSANNPDIAVGRHAISIDEHRAFFRTNLWRLDPKKPSGPRDLKQVWFAGVHCDVGGGYAEADLSDIALDWMVQEAKPHGLIVDSNAERDVLKLGADGQFHAVPNARPHESLTWKWWLAEFIWKRHYNWNKAHWEHRPNLFRHRTIPPQSSIHDSVYTRGDEYLKRIPQDAVKVFEPASPDGDGRRKLVVTAGDEAACTAALVSR